MNARSRSVLGTVGYGDCGLDLMCMMLGNEDNTEEPAAGEQLCFDDACDGVIVGMCSDSANDAASDTESDGTDSN